MRKSVSFLLSGRANRVLLMAADASFASSSPSGSIGASHLPDASTSGNLASSSSSAVASSATSVKLRPMDRLLWGDNIVQRMRNMPVEKQLEVMATKYQGQSQPFPLLVYANAALELIGSQGPNGVEKAAELVLSRPFPSERCELIELIAGMVPIEDSNSAWAFVTKLQFIENGAVLRASLKIAQKTGDRQIVNEVLHFVSTTCRRKKQLAGEVLRSFCEVLPSNRWAEGHELLDFAQQSGNYFDIQEIDELLWLMLKARQHKRVLGMWSWIKNTTAGNSSSIVSAVIVSLTREHQRLADVLKLMQHLARNDEDPLPAAQIATIELMASMRRPNAEYASDLVNYWQYIDGHTAMRLNLAVAAAHAKLNTHESLVAASKAISKIADDPSQVRELRPQLIVTIAPLLLCPPSSSASSSSAVSSSLATSGAKEAFLRLASSIAEDCAQRLSLVGLGVVLAIATLTESNALFKTFVRRFKEIVGSDIFDFEAATTAAAPLAIAGLMSSSYSSSLLGGGGSTRAGGVGFFDDDVVENENENEKEEGDAEVRGFGASSNDFSSSAAGHLPSSSNQLSDAQNSYNFVCRELFASLRASHFVKGKETASALASALSSSSSSSAKPEGLSTDGGDGEMIDSLFLDVSVPRDSAEWFTLISHDDTDDASVILDALGREE